jgi:N6-L-threonylcarbamoyladenine synthase/protein kinase Bud32
MTRWVLACDTANEVVAVGVGRLDDRQDVSSPVACAVSLQVPAHRASNTTLVPTMDQALEQAGAAKDDIVALVCGRGPGSFTGVRICLATAKGAASALEVPLFGVSTLDAVAWGAWQAGRRGCTIVVADAMRKEVYPVLYRLDEDGVERLTSDTVVKAVEAPDWIARELAHAGIVERPLITGDGLTKYREVFEPCGEIAPEELWAVTGAGLLAAERTGGNPATLLPVYTRLSDAEENERKRLAAAEAPTASDPKDLHTGVQAEGALTYRPLDAAHVDAVADLERRTMTGGAWTASMIADELPRTDRTWWAAFDGTQLVGYAGGLVAAGEVQLLKVAVEPAYRRRGIARHLIGLVASDARDLGASRMSLEVRTSNTNAQALYRALGLTSLGTRPGYYQDGEDACIMAGPLPMDVRDVAGMTLRVDDVAESSEARASDAATDGAEGAPKNEAGTVRACDVEASEAATHTAGAACDGAAATDASDASAQCESPLILAVESSCDETACAVIDGSGTMHADVVASQIDFHARFGGVVPEIASRKHIEAICGVADVCLEKAAESLGAGRLRYRELDAVAVTYAPGLVGALVVGVAFAKGVAWGADIPLIAVNHLEGHLYANRLAEPDITPPMVVSLVSGGHTLLVHVRDWGDYRTLGSTIDDAVGEAFDKVAKALGLGYPGGPAISKLAAQGNPKAINFPRALMHSHDLRFSLSGLKTAVITYIHQEQQAGHELNMPDIAASFTAAVVDVQVSKARTALKQTGAKVFCLGGGVAANPDLRRAYEKMCADEHVRLVMPPLSACGDNAAMIAEVALDRYRQGRFADATLDVKAHAPLDEPY